MTEQRRILVVDDTEDNRNILRARLESQGFLVEEASDGREAVEKEEIFAPDLIIMDIMMPVMDGISATKLIKARHSDGFLPIILLTAKSDARTVIEGLDAGADEFLTKPVDHAALMARIRVMFRIKDLQDNLAEKSQDLAALNSSLEEKVKDQVAQLERVSRLSEFLPPQVVEIITDPEQGRDLLASHRAEVSVVFSDLRGFTPFAETAEPEDIIDVLREYHDVVGQSAFRHGGTIERFAGDGVMVFFNDPVPLEDHQKRAVEFGFDVLALVSKLSSAWRDRDIDLGVGIASPQAMPLWDGWASRKNGITPRLGA